MTDPLNTTDAELSLIGAVLIDPSILTQVSIDRRDFNSEWCRRAWTAINKLQSDGIPPDLVTLQPIMREKGDLAALSDAMRCLPHARNWEAYQNQIQTGASLRSLNQALLDALDRVRAGETEVVPELTSTLMALQGTDQRFITNLDDCIGEVLQQLQDAVHGQLEGIAWNFPTLNRWLGIRRNTDLIVVAARPAMGKTAFGLGSFSVTDSVGVISGEMAGDQLAARLMAVHGGFNLNLLRVQPTQEQADAAAVNATYLQGNRLQIYQRPNPSIGQVQTVARQWVYQHGIKLLVVDYIQLLRPDHKHGTRTEEVAEVVRGLKQLARELRIPVIALAQVNRGVESRDDKRPMASDIRDSGVIEQEADQILMLYRDEVYNRGTPLRNIAEVIIVKNRHGQCTTAFLKWIPERTKFGTLSQAEEFRAEQMLDGMGE